MSRTRRLAAILAADVAGYSRLIGADEEKHPGAFPLESGRSPDAGPSDAGQCGSAAARPSWAATACKRRSRVHNLLPAVSRTAASKWAST
jgi:hypothetical protein